MSQKFKVGMKSQIYCLNLPDNHLKYSMNIIENAQLRNIVA